MAPREGRARPRIRAVHMWGPYCHVESAPSWGWERPRGEQRVRYPHGVTGEEEGRALPGEHENVCRLKDPREQDGRELATSHSVVAVIGLLNCFPV